MKTPFRTTLLAAAAVCALALTGQVAPGVAAPMQASAGLRQAGPTLDASIAVRAERKARRSQARRAQRPRLYVPPYGMQGGDTVGSLGTDSQGRTINRFSGQVYQTCMIDEGYGRVRPCDAGGSGGGGSLN